MAGVASSVIAQAPAAIDRRRAWIDDTGGFPDGILLTREKYNGYPAPDMWNLRTVSLSLSAAQGARRDSRRGQRRAALPCFDRDLCSRMQTSSQADPLANGQLQLLPGHLPR
jgi:hypothetical protein